MSYQPNKEMQDQIDKGSVSGIKTCLIGIIFSDRTLSNNKFEEAIAYIKKEDNIRLMENYDGGALVKHIKEYSQSNTEDFKEAVFLLKNNFCEERIEELKNIANVVYPSEKIIKNETEKNYDYKISTQNKNHEKSDEKKMKITILILGIAIATIAIVNLIKKQ